MSRLPGNPAGLAPALIRLPHLPPSLWLVAAAVAAVAATLPGLWTLSGLAAIVMSLLIVVKPEIGIYLLTLSVPLGSLAEIEGSSFAVTPTEVLVALLVLGWATRALARRRLSIPRTQLTLPLVAMLTLVIFSAFQATDFALTVKETLKWLELILVFLFVVAEMGTARQCLTLLLLLFAGAGIEALLGIAQFALGLGPDSFAIGRFMRAFGTFEQPNPYAGYLGMLIPLAVGLLLTRPAPRVRKYALGVCLLALVAVGVSLSRGAWMSIALAIALMAMFWSPRSRILLVAGLIATAPIAALAFLNLLPVELSSRLATALDYFRFVDVRQEVVTPQNWAVVERVAHWQAALDMIAQYPLFGVGAGNYPAVYDAYALPGWREALGHAHNYYLNIAAETGIPGLLVYLLVLTVALLQAAKGLLRSAGDSDLTPQPPFPTGKGTTTPPLVGEGQGERLASIPAAAPGRDITQGQTLLWRGILAGVLGSLVASSVHNLFDSLFVHSMSVQIGMILALGQVSSAALSRSTPRNGSMARPA